MRRTFWILILLPLILVACLGGGEDPTSTPFNRFPSTVTSVPSFVPQANTTPTTVVQFVVPTATTAGIGPVVPPITNCSIPTGWQAYTIRAGDTLNVLAASVGSTASVIQSANCLTNADAIYVDQLIYLPSLPAFIPTIQATVPTSTCAVPTDWQAYSVAGGDTLGIIAVTIGSTIVELQNANCLSNPDAIYVGQILYLPRLPAVGSTPVPTSVIAQTPVPIVTSTLPVFTQLLRITPTQLRSDGASITVTRQIVLDIGIVNNAISVQYLAGTSATDQNPVVVGNDNSPSNGTAFNYTLTDFDTELFFIVVARNNSGTIYSNIVHLVYDPNFGVIPTATSEPSTSSVPSVQPILGFANNIYTLETASSVTVSWADAPTNASQIIFYYLPSGSSNFQIIGTDANPSNGAIIGWIVPSALQGQIFARATYASGQVSDSLRINVMSQ